MLDFLKNALLRGLVILIPTVLVYITLRELVEIMIGFATPLADLISEDWIREDDPVGLIALVLILLVSLALGLIWSARPTRRAAIWLEAQTFDRVPMYRMVKSLVAAFLDLEEKESFKPACWRHEDGSLEPVFVIEEYDDDMFVVLQPWTPTPFAGSIRVVPRIQVDLVPVTLDEYSLSLTHYGLELSKSLQKREAEHS
jgi:uncharacterized membrane protein